MAIGTGIFSAPTKETDVAKPEWGTKRICANCSARFYDLKRHPIVCPKCEAVFDPAQLTRLKRSRSTPPPEPAKKVEAKDEAAKVADVDADGDDDADVEDDDDSVLEDASDLAGDGDIEEIVDVAEKEKTED